MEFRNPKLPVTKVGAKDENETPSVPVAANFRKTCKTHRHQPCHTRIGTGIKLMRPKHHPHPAGKDLGTHRWPTANRVQNSNQAGGLAGVRADVFF